MHGNNPRPPPPPPSSRPPPPPPGGGGGQQRTTGRSPPPPPPGGVGGGGGGRSSRPAPPPPGSGYARGGGGGGGDNRDRGGGRYHPHSHRPQQQQPPPPSRPKIVPRSYEDGELPSIQDGISPVEEKIKRSKTCRFIEEAGRILKLPRVAIATAMVFFHRFFAKHSFVEHDRFEVAVACILLAAKTEESPKKLNAVIIECHRLKNRGMARSSNSAASSAAGRSGGAGGGGSPSRMPEGEILDQKSDEYLKLKERILLLERVILHTIAFELSVDHPYKFLVDQIKKMNQQRQIEYVDPRSKQPSKMLPELLQVAMNFANDSMHTTLCLQYPAKSVAHSCVYMSAKFCKIRLVDPKKQWTDVLGMESDALASICDQTMELISNKKGGEISVFKSIRADLETLKKASGAASRSGSGALTASSSSSSLSGRKQGAPPPPSDHHHRDKRPRPH